MEKPLVDLADRLDSAMKAVGVSASQLAREMGVSPTAIHYVLKRESLKMSADNYDSAARALGVRSEWLRTGKLPRERDTREVQTERLQAALRDLREPLTALLDAVNELYPPEQSRKKRSGP
jgi:transcriptional regulator with XRE-family HTH domain